MVPLRVRQSLVSILIRVSSVFHPWLKDLLLRCFQDECSIRGVESNGANHVSRVQELGWPPPRPLEAAGR